jgi:hypothetical protein
MDNLGDNSGAISSAAFCRPHSHSGGSRTAVYSVRMSLPLNALNSPPRVQAHAAAALINFCEGVAHDTLVPYLDPIVERLLKLLHAGGGSGVGAKRYVQEQAITTLAMVADASEATFAKVCYYAPSHQYKISKMRGG